MKIFLLEDDYLLNKAITQYLTSKGFTVSSFYNGSEALNAIMDDFALMILDIDVPDMNGVSVLQEIRKLYPAKPIIMISATIDIDMISKAYEKGCNDYLKKPFDIRELELKIRAFTQTAVNSMTITEGLEYTLADQRLMFHSRQISLTPMEKKLFHILVENKGRTISMELLERAIWGMSGDAIHLRQLVARLRKKLPENTIQNKTGSGYCIV
ncbi:MAG: response regulator transcription factor [Sulfuricurvum sp.]|nr:response regulator transcription factor [Sulfuricurvum sp.]MDP3023128.1 response regulator transcription factor [Sulfuricurvum sp.]MDP3120441.1 response regulator transcription factor [Sulfuricurvum sp.]